MVTVLSWSVEFLGFTIVFIGTHILGHQNNIINLSLQTITNFIYFVLVPLVLIIHESDFKGRIVENPYFDSFLAMVNLKYEDEDQDHGNDEESQDIEENNTTS